MTFKFTMESLKGILYDIGAANCLEIAIPRKESAKIAKKIMVVLDTSGSMSGAPIRHAIEGIKHLRDNVDISAIITYNSGTKYHPVNGAEQINEVLDDINCEDRTNFVSVFDSITMFAQMSRINEKVIIVFFTDGMETVNSPENIKKGIDKLYDSCKDKPFEFHTIGLGEFHDARLLDAITRIGTSLGTFQYAEKPEELSACMAQLISVINEECFSGYLYNGDNFVGMLTFEDSIGHLFGDFAKDSPHILKLRKNGPNNTFGVKIEACAENNPYKLAKLTHKYVQALIRAIMPSVSNQSDRSHLKVLASEIKKLNDILTENIAKIKKLAILQRKELYPENQQLKDLLFDLNSAITNAIKRELTMDNYAKLNDKSFRASKKSLRRKLDNRIQENSDKFEALDKKVARELAALPQELPKLDLEPEPCIITSLDWRELLKEGDCLCIALGISRPESAIADPTQVIINEIYPSFVSAESFMEGVLYSGNDIGFTRNNSGGYFTGAAGEKISGILPLYLCDNHWKIARHKLPPIMGWMATLTPYGYSPAQINAIPFAVLSKAIENIYANNSEHNMKICELILATCVNIYSDYMINTGLIFANYTDPKSCEVRLPDFCPNNRVFLAQIVAGIGARQINRPETPKDAIPFFMAVLEEEFRRKIHKELRYLSSGQIMDKIWDILNIDPEYYQPHINRFQAITEGGAKKVAESKYRSLFAQLQGISTPEVENPQQNSATDNLPKLKSIDDCDDFTTITARFRPDACLFKDADNDFKFIQAFFFIIFDSVIEQDEDSELPWFCSIIQNILQHSSERRRKALKNYVSQLDFPEGDFVDYAINHYIDFNNNLGLINAMVYIKQFISATVVNYIKVEQQKILDNANTSKTSELAKLFAETSDLDAAAGMLYGAHIGREIGYYARALQNKANVPLVLEKLRMLVTGKFRGVLLIPDIGHGWAPSKRNIFRFWMTHRQFIKYEEWLDLFPANSHAISCRYDFEDGVYINDPHVQGSGTPIN